MSGRPPSSHFPFPVSHALVLSAIVAGYTILGFLLLAPEAVYSGDVGVKYVQARALVSNGFASLDLPYPGEFLDPAREFFPLRPPFVMTAGGSTQAIFPPTATLIQAPAVWLAGIRGLIAMSIASAAVILWAAWKLTPAPYGLAVLIALGVGGPLWFYAVCGLEHAPAVALSTAAFVAASRGSRTSSALAGGLAGAGATLRDETLLVLPGLLLAIWLFRRDARSAAHTARPRAGAPTVRFVHGGEGGSGAGQKGPRERPSRGPGRSPGLVLIAAAAALVPLTVAVAIEVWWFDRPAAAHLRHAVNVVQAALEMTGEAGAETPVLQTFTMSQRYETVVNYWLAGSSRNGVLAMFAAAFATALALRWRWRTPVGFVVCLLGLTIVAAGDLHEVLTAPKWLAGLFRVAPYVALAFIPAPPGAPRQRWPLIALVTSVTFLVLAYAGVNTTGGKSLGPRLLLPLVPLLTVSAVIRTAQYLGSERHLDRLVGFTGAALFLSSIAFHLGGTIPAYRVRSADDSSAVLAAAADPARIVVSDDPFTVQLLFPLYYQKIVLLADTGERSRRLGALLTGQRVPRVILVSRRSSPAFPLTPLDLERVEPQGRMMIQYWRR